MSYYGNMSIPETCGKAGDEEEMNIYANADTHDVRTETEITKRHQTPQHTGNETHLIIITTPHTHFSHFGDLRNIYIHIGHLQKAPEQL